MVYVPINGSLRFCEVVSDFVYKIFTSLSHMIYLTLFDMGGGHDGPPKCF